MSADDRDSSAAQLLGNGGKIELYYMSLQYCNKSKSQLTSPTPAQLPAVALSAGHIVYYKNHAATKPTTTITFF
jgi:hypothetical protein